MKTSPNSADKLAQLCVEKSLSVSVAESCTGGLAGSYITAIPGASAFFKGGVIAYHNAIKASVLKVPDKILSRYGAVSPQTVKAMAAGVSKLMHTSCAIAISGIAGPDGGTMQKPVGLVFIGVLVNRKVKTFKCLFKGSREDVRRKAAERSLMELVNMIGTVNSKTSLTGNMRKG